MSEVNPDRVRRRLRLNSLSNVGRFAFLMVIAFVLTSLIVRTLGDSVYGFWVLLMAFLGYASILEMGVVVYLVAYPLGRLLESEDYASMVIGVVITLVVHGLLATALVITTRERDKLRTWIRDRLPAR